MELLYKLETIFYFQFRVLLSPNCIYGKDSIFKQRSNDLDKMWQRIDFHEENKCKYVHNYILFEMSENSEQQNKA